MKSFQVFKNAAPYKKVKAKSIEELIGILRDMARLNRQDYFEYRNAEGKLVPVFC